MSIVDKLKAAIEAAHERLADGLRRLSDFHTSGDLESAKAVSAQLGATHAELVRAHAELHEPAKAPASISGATGGAYVGSAPIDADGVDDSEMYDRDNAAKAEGPGSGVI